MNALACPHYSTTTHTCNPPPTHIHTCTHMHTHINSMHLTTDFLPCRLTHHIFHAACGYSNAALFAPSLNRRSRAASSGPVSSHKALIHGPPEASFNGSSPQQIPLEACWWSLKGPTITSLSTHTHTHTDTHTHTSERKLRSTSVVSPVSTELNIRVLSRLQVMPSEASKICTAQHYSPLGDISQILSWIYRLFLSLLCTYPV